MATKTKPAGALTDAERGKLLAELEASPANAAPAVVKLTPRERAIASLMRERDHLDGCPSTDEADPAVPLVEAYESITPAPGKALRNQGAQVGDAVVTVRCMRCAATRYLLSPAPRGTVPIGVGRHVSAVLVKHLRGNDDDGVLDGTL